MSNLDYKLPEPTKAQLEYARYLSRFQAPRERRTLFARTESDIAAAFREERPRTIPGTPTTLPPRPVSVPGLPMLCSSGAKPRLKRCSPQPMRWG